MSLMIVCLEWFIVLKSTVSWYQIKSNQPEQEYYLPHNTEREYIAKFEILFCAVFWK